MERWVTWRQASKCEPRWSIPQAFNRLKAERLRSAIWRYLTSIVAIASKCVGVRNTVSMVLLDRVGFHLKLIYVVRNVLALDKLIHYPKPPWAAGWRLAQSAPTKR